MKGGCLLDVECKRRGRQKWTSYSEKKKALEREKQKNFIPEVTGLKISNITNHHYSLKGSKLTGKSRVIP